MKLRTCHRHRHRHCQCHSITIAIAIALSSSSLPFATVSRYVPRPAAKHRPRSLHQLQSKFHIKRHRNIRAVAACRNHWCAIQAIPWRWRSCANARCICSHRSVQAAVRLGSPSSPPGNCCHHLWHLNVVQIVFNMFIVVVDGFPF